MKVAIQCERVIGSVLKPGELFSTVGPEYWEDAMDKGSIGERVFIRTNSSAENVDDSAEYVYRITIHMLEDSEWLERQTELEIQRAEQERRNNADA